MRSNTDDMQFVGKDEDLATYNYYAYLSSGSGSRSIVMRMTKDETEVKYAYGIGSAFVADWATKATLNYKLPSALGGRG